MHNASVWTDHDNLFFGASEETPVWKLLLHVPECPLGTPPCASDAADFVASSLREGRKGVEAVSEPPHTSSCKLPRRTRPLTVPRRPRQHPRRGGEIRGATPSDCEASLGKTAPHVASPTLKTPSPTRTPRTLPPPAIVLLDGPHLTLPPPL